MDAVAPLLAVLLAQGDMAAIPAGNLEGRPPPGETSPLQARVDAAAPGERIEVGPGTYEGDLYLDRPVHLAGRGRPRLVGSGRGSVVRVRAPGVVVEGFDVDGREGGDLGRDSAGVHVAARDAVIRDCRIGRALFGIYLREANGARIEGNVVTGIRSKEPGEKGSGIHVWNTDGFTLERNEIRDARDGFYIQSSPHGVVRGNVARELRYALHYMFSDDNVFEDNLFERSDAGAVLMYSRRIAFRRNRFLHNRGFASVGLLYKACDDVIAEDNLIADNARGVFLEGSYRDVFRRNVIAESDAAIVLYDSCGGVRFEGNAFVGNLTTLDLVGRRTDTGFDGNYWSDDRGLDLDGDGRNDAPHVLGSLFDHLRGNLSAADLLAQSVAASALAAAERSFPVLARIQAVDHAPLARPPVLPAVPVARPEDGGAAAAGVAGSAGAVGLGLAVLALGGRAARRGRP
ncbi:Carbohydrate-binding and sugar hydrolysis [Anaeromyxobacter dehalogenans 2CP-1]|uniref:Carbohydrate-binding and sugar hydrolysis n=1 Tax=Anaeromyxobacter dehalogenans (strain ATCC BAA-258 / DSM 21875 / 2CP-1) TaxID=455488 RepID=B8J547_ANAD2|nr:nitrous oxide reductase family maturation protein NosD [Anaeromyxobacter dehalogenans]ACL64902.1 Carbohydrate-binding and sugar hydrolysis [Anaeromyxobacter dehalogenans 2CP-1]